MKINSLWRDSEGNVWTLKAFDAAHALLRMGQRRRALATRDLLADYVMVS